MACIVGAGGSKETGRSQELWLIQHCSVNQSACLSFFYLHTYLLFFTYFCLTSWSALPCPQICLGNFWRLHTTRAPCGLRGCKNGPAPFPGRMPYKATKPGLVCLSYLSMLYYCNVVYYGPFYVLLVFVADVCSVFWLFWLSCHYLPSDWLELERPLWGSLTVARGSTP